MHIEAQITNNNIAIIYDGDKYSTPHGGSKTNSSILFLIIYNIALLPSLAIPGLLKFIDICKVGITLFSSEPFQH